MKKIMIVDDEKDQIFSVKTGFETAYPNKYEIIGAESGKKCFQLLEKKVIPDIILLDIMMPTMNGWEVFDKLRASQKYKNIPSQLLLCALFPLTVLLTLDSKNIPSQLLLFAVFPEIVLLLLLLNNIPEKLLLFASFPEIALLLLMFKYIP